MFSSKMAPGYINPVRFVGWDVLGRRARECLARADYVNRMLARGVSSGGRANSHRHQFICSFIFLAGTAVFKYFENWRGMGGYGCFGRRYDQSQGVFTLDANGYPTSMNGIGPAAGQTFTEIDTLVLRNVGVSGNQCSVL